MSKPTEQAQHFFKMAAGSTLHWPDPALSDVQRAINQLAVGLEHLTVGLRATYMKLEEIESKLEGGGPIGHGPNKVTAMLRAR